jgi:hypothetical protein
MNMNKEHPNIALLKRFDPTNVAETVDVFAEDVIWHYYNPRLTDLHDDDVGRGGRRSVPFGPLPRPAAGIIETR